MNVQYTLKQKLKGDRYIFNIYSQNYLQLIMFFLSL